MRLPSAPPDLPDRPHRFYARLAELLLPLELEWADAEDDGVTFGDAGIGVVFTHAKDPDWVVSAQVSRVDAIVFIGPAAHHLDTPEAAAELMVAGLAGAVSIALGYRGDALVEVISRDATGAELSRAAVGGPGAWARWRPLTHTERRMSYLAAAASRT